MSILRPEESPLFNKWVDPTSGVASYILSERVAPLQKAYYYTNSGFSADGRYLWFECAFPPAPGKLHAVADLLENTVRIFHETQHTDGYPYIDPRDGTMYWSVGTELWKRGSQEGGIASFVNALPKEVVRKRSSTRLSTHLTPSADGKSLSVDTDFGDEWVIGDLPLDGSDFCHWTSFDRCYNHVQFSPVDPDLMLIMQDSWHDRRTGIVHNSFDRLWLIRRGGRAYQVLPDDPMPSANRGHEWWGNDGRHIWFLDYTEGPKQGTKKVCLETGEVTTLWKRGHSHSHCNSTGTYFVGDIASWPKDEWEVAFYNSKTNVDLSIVKLLPPCDLRRKYHIHPHPHFCLNDQYICYTTNVLGQVDVALTPVSDLLERTN